MRKYLLNDIFCYQHICKHVHICVNCMKDSQEFNNNVVERDKRHSH